LRIVPPSVWLELCFFFSSLSFLPGRLFHYCYPFSVVDGFALFFFTWLHASVRNLPARIYLFLPTFVCAFGFCFSLFTPFPLLRENGPFFLVLPPHEPSLGPGWGTRTLKFRGNHTPYPLSPFPCFVRSFCCLDPFPSEHLNCWVHLKVPVAWPFFCWVLMSCDGCTPRERLSTEFFSSFFLFSLR